METQNRKNSHKSDMCNIDVDSAWLAKYLKSKKHLDHRELNPSNSNPMNPT